MKRPLRKRVRFIILLSVAVYVSTVLIYQRFIGAPKTRGAALLYKIEPVKNFSFSSPDSLKDWDEKVFRGRASYNIENEKESSYVRASSDGSASALYYEIKLDARKKFPVIKWKWKAEEFPVKKFEESLDKENEDDFAARLYVIFPAVFITNSRVLEYVWAEKLPAGATGTSPYSRNIKLIVLRSGKGNGDGWFSEERDIVADYIRMFGRPPEYNIGAIAFMTNAEHTESRAEAKYDEIEIGYKEDDKTKGGRTP